MMNCEEIFRPSNPDNNVIYIIMKYSHDNNVI